MYKPSWFLRYLVIGENLLDLIAILLKLTLKLLKHRTNISVPVTLLLNQTFSINETLLADSIDAFVFTHRDGDFSFRTWSAYLRLFADVKKKNTRGRSGRGEAS